MSRHRDLVPGSRAAANAAAGRSVTAKTATDLSSDRRVEPASRLTAEPPRSLQGARGDVEFLPRALLSVDEPSSPVRKVVFCSLTALLLTALAWSYFGRLASYATAPGKVQVVGRTKVLETQQSGQVTEIRVRDGDSVQTGDVMVRLDPGDAVASRTIVVDQRADLYGQNDRRRVEIAAARADSIPLDPPITWDENVPQRIRDRETGVLRANLARLAGTLSTLASRRAAAVVEVGKFSGLITAQKALLAVTAENSSMADQLQQSGWNSRAKSLDLVESLRGQQVSLTSFEGQLADAQASLATLDSGIVKTRDGFVSTETDALAEAERQVADLDQQLVKADKTLAQTTLRAPVSGIVHASAVTTIGQFIRPGQQLMQIVPQNAPVEIVAYVQNTDVGLIRSGQDVNIKVDSFNFATYGALDGVVDKVGSDALPTDGKSAVQSATLDGGYGGSTAAQHTNLLKYPVTIHPNNPVMLIDGEAVTLAPGMAVTVEIETENRRVIEYVTTPIVNLLSTAAHER